MISASRGREVGVGEGLAAGRIPLGRGRRRASPGSASTTSGCASWNDGRNQRASTASAIAPMPPARTTRGALDPPLPWAGTRAPCSSRARRSTRSGRVHGEPHALDAAEREPAERDPLERRARREGRRGRRRGRRSSSGPAARASGRARAGRSERPGTARRVGRPAAPTSRASCRASSRARAPERRPGPSRTWWSVTGAAALGVVARERPVDQQRRPSRDTSSGRARRRSPRASGSCRGRRAPRPATARSRAARSDASRTSARAAVRPSRVGEDERDPLGDRPVRR